VDVERSSDARRTAVESKPNRNEDMDVMDDSETKIRVRCAGEIPAH